MPSLSLTWYSMELQPVKGSLDTQQLMASCKGSGSSPNISASKWPVHCCNRYSHNSSNSLHWAGSDGLHLVKVGDWGVELNREIVSCRACVRAVCMSSEFGVKISGPTFSLLPFRRGRFSLFPSPGPPISYPASAGFIGTYQLQCVELWKFGKLAPPSGEVTTAQ